MDNDPRYVPGVCNMGAEERRRRKRVGWTGLVMTAALWVLFVRFDFPPGWRLTLFVPALISAMGFLQAAMRFCVYFGFSSLFNLGRVGAPAKVEREDFRVKDRAQAWKLLGYATLLAGMVAGMAYKL